MQLPIFKNPFYIHRYLKFIESRPGQKIKYNTDLHHILPKSKGFFPEFKNITEHSWNGVYLTFREHFIAHRLLHRAFPGSTQTRAYYLMCNEQQKMNSLDYNNARQYHITKMKEWFQDPIKMEARSKKLSIALTGKKKTAEHIAKLVGHEVTVKTREKIRLKNIGKKASNESCAIMVASRTGQIRGKYKEGTGQNISAAVIGLRTYNDGSIEKRAKLCPGEGWVLGQLRDSNAKGKHWFTNGIDCIMVKCPPDKTWWAGRIISKTK